jgi:hypothetical protein
MKTDSTLMKRLALLAAVASVVFSSGCAHKYATGAALNGIIDHISTDPPPQGSTGHLRCVFVSGSATPATKWGKDGATPTVAVQAYPGGAYTTVTATGHPIGFTATGATPPPNTSVSFAAGECKTIWIRY